jgi:Uncharacterized protein conserved in bacteria
MLRSKIEEIAPSNIFNIQTFPYDLTEQIDELIELQMIYKSAVKEISTKLEILDDEFQTKHKRNPIHTIQSRVKTPESIFRKLERKGFEISLKSARENLYDIAGIRVVCAYIDDIYTIANMLKSQDDITVIKETDYIKSPKPNGYRSLHLVIKVPVFFSNHTELLPVEVQIRTIAMDFWASLEHQLHYKASEDISEDLIYELKECADNISSIDQRMQNIHNTVEELSSSNED